MDPGDYVIDSDDDAPDLAVVVHRPGVSIEAIPVIGGDAVRSVAADNPAYDSGTGGGCGVCRVRPHPVLARLDRPSG